MPRRRADQMVIVKPPLLGPDRVADAALSPHEVVDDAPQGHHHRDERSERSPASSPQYAANARVRLTAARTMERFFACR
jgi:hypothetical protein